MRHPSNKESIVQRLKREFFTGLLVLLPLGLSVAIVVWLFNFIDNILGNFITQTKGVGVILVIILIWGVGVISRTMLGKFFLRIGGRIIHKVPLFGSLFRTTKQISLHLAGKKGKSFKHVVILEYPKKGLYAMGFITSEAASNFKKKKLVHVFVPTTPNPTSGFLILAERRYLQPIDMKVEKALETIISLGSIHPALYKTKKL